MKGLWVRYGCHIFVSLSRCGYRLSLPPSAQLMTNAHNCEALWSLEKNYMNPIKNKFNYSHYNNYYYYITLYPVLCIALYSQKVTAI